MRDSRQYVRGLYPSALCVTDESECFDTFTVQVQGQFLCEPGVYVTADGAWDAAAEKARIEVEEETG